VNGIRNVNGKCHIYHAYLSLIGTNGSDFLVHTTTSTGTEIWQYSDRRDSRVHALRTV